MRVEDFTAAALHEAVTQRFGLADAYRLSRLDSGHRRTDETVRSDPARNGVGSDSGASGLPGKVTVVAGGDTFTMESETGWVRVRNWRSRWRPVQALY